MTLFVPGPVTLASGRTSNVKVECDALTPDDWRGLALLAREMELVPPFGRVEGVPNGGHPFAIALQPHATCRCAAPAILHSDGGRGKCLTHHDCPAFDPIDRLLIADDVLTTGGSMERHRAGRDAVGLVAFARGPLPAWVTAVWAIGGGPADARAS